MFPALLRAPQSLNVVRRYPLPALSLSFLLCFLGAPTLLALVTAWRRHPDYDYAWLLAPVVAWLFIRAAPWRCVAEPRPVPGIVTIGVGGLIHLTAQVIIWPMLDFAAWLLIGRGVLLACWGNGAVRRGMPVLLFAFFLFPLPLAWLNALAAWMQDVISGLASAMLGLFWVCFRQGSVIHVAGLDTPLSVAVECSGVRQVLVFAALGSLLALFVQGTGRRLLLVAVAVPVAVLANLIRVLVLAFVARLAGPGAIQGMLHDMPLLITLPLGSLGLWWLYLQLKTKPLLPSEHLPGICPSYLPVCGVLLVLSGLQFALQWHLLAVGPATLPPSIDLSTLPAGLGDWRGTPHPEAAQVALRSDFADATLTRVYADPYGNACAVCLVYSSTGRDREHHPEICLRDAAGARELTAARTQVTLPSGVAQRFAYQRDSTRRTTVYYWHYTLLPHHQGLDLLQTLYLRQHERPPSLTVEVQVNVTDPAVWHTIEMTLLPELDRSLHGLLPPVRVGSDRLPIRYTGE